MYSYEQQTRKKKKMNLKEQINKHKHRKYKVPPKEKDRTSMTEHMFFYDQVKNYYQQIYQRNAYMKNFIDIEIDAYLLSDLTRSFKEEWCYSGMTNLTTSIISFNAMFEHIKECKPILADLLKDFAEFQHQWIQMKKDKNGKFVKNSSKYMKLVFARMKVKNFNERHQKRFNELMSTSTIKEVVNHSEVV